MPLSSQHKYEEIGPVNIVFQSKSLQSHANVNLLQNNIVSMCAGEVSKYIFSILADVYVVFSVWLTLNLVLQSWRLNQSGFQYIHYSQYIDLNCLERNVCSCFCFGLLV